MTPAPHGANGSLEALLQRLDGVQKSGAGYRARCPACGGRSRKVSITPSDDSRILIHAFCGCPTLEVLHAIGLGMADLFPVRLAPQTDHDRRSAWRSSRQSHWGAALSVLAVEALVVLIAARQLMAWKCLSAEDAQRLSHAVDRIDQAKAVLRDVPEFRR